MGGICGKPSRKEYRHFNIKSVEGIDDFASMREIVRAQRPMVSLFSASIIAGVPGAVNR